MAEYIERKALLADIDAAMDNAGMGRVVGQTLKRYIKRQPTADVVEVVPELRKAVKLLHNEYETAKKLDFVYDPIAYAVYQVWKAVDGRRKNGRW